MRVAILDDYQGVALDSADWSALEARAELLVYRDHLANEDALVERLVDAEIVVAMRERTPFERSLVERLPNLRLLITTGARNASFDLEALRDAGVTVCGTGGRGAATAELTWGPHPCADARHPARACCDRRRAAGSSRSAATSEIRPSA